MNWNGLSGLAAVVVVEWAYGLYKNNMYVSHIPVWQKWPSYLIQLKFGGKSLKKSLF